MYTIKIYYIKIRQMNEKKIDGVIVMLEALGAYMADPCYNALL